jgi:tellurite resistance protein
MRNFTPEDLLEFHYNEMQAEERKEMIKTLRENWSLREKLAVIREAANRLNKSIEKPRKESVKTILEYAGRFQKASFS